ncbi:MAG: hypothetical protein IJ364_02705, partial [Oscillospiraceae bacterium]|nr:hypothetical protein [Oscillospiraceae bacterium]
NIVNNYLGSLKMTQALLMDEINVLREIEEPVVCLFYGDHKPHLGNTVYEEAGIAFDQSTALGQIDYYSTPYYIWANDAAKELCGNDFMGAGPTVSPGYIMGVLFEQIGWKGSAYMQFVQDIMKDLPVVSTKGVYIADGEPCLGLSEEDKNLLRQYESVQYLLNSSFSIE